MGIVVGKYLALVLANSRCSIANGGYHFSSTGFVVV